MTNFNKSTIMIEDIINNLVFVVIPNWDSSRKVMIPASCFPIKAKLSVGMNFLAQVNISASDVSELDCHDIEVIP